MNFEISAADVQDAYDIAQILRRSIRELCENDHKNNENEIHEWCENKTQDQVTKWITHPGTICLAAKADQHITGFAMARIDGFIALLYVSPNYRFQGISSALLQNLEEQLCAIGIETARVETTKTAEKFYRRRGYHGQRILSRKLETWLHRSGCGDCD